MIIYSESLKNFVDQAQFGEIAAAITRMYRKQLGRDPSPGEHRSWTNSLHFLAVVADKSGLDRNSRVSVEYQVPSSAKRIDVLFTGYGKNKSPAMVIVELKQWHKSEVTDQDGILNAPRYGHALSRGPHPSYQAWSYATLLQDFNEVVNTTPVNLYPCAFLHNHPLVPEGEGLLSSCYDEYLEKAPVFLSGRTEMARLADFLTAHLPYGDTGDVIDMVDRSRIVPSKELGRAVVSMLKGKEVFTLIDEQKVVYEAVKKAILNKKQKFVIIVNGGPGTGKSVVAINLLAHLTHSGRCVTYVTKNSAPRNVYESLLKEGKFKKKDISALFRGPDTFWKINEEFFDCVLVDEAHRLRTKSGIYSNEGECQIRELIQACKLPVFFIDDRQRVHFKDAGTTDAIRKEAVDLGLEVLEFTLPSQFRCSGSDGYMAWLDQWLGIRETANLKLDTSQYDFRVFDKATAMLETLKELNAQGRGREARLLAGYCWEWKSKKNSDAFDIVLDNGDFKKQWNLSSDGGLWLLNDTELNQVGCIHTVQGLEIPYVGVIIGPDLLVRDGKVVTNFTNRSSQDRSIHGLKKMYKSEPERALQIADEIIKNTYRVLMTRGQKGCFIYSEDPETRKWFSDALQKGNTDF